MLCQLEIHSFNSNLFLCRLSYCIAKFQINFQLININIPEFLVVVTYIFQEESHIGSFLVWAAKQNPVFHCGLRNIDASFWLL